MAVGIRLWPNGERTTGGERSLVRRINILYRNCVAKLTGPAQALFAAGMRQIVRAPESAFTVASGKLVFNRVSLVSMRWKSSAGTGRLK